MSESTKLVYASSSSIEGFEIEEFSALPKEETDKSQSWRRTEKGAKRWVQCDNCQKWRRVPNDLQDEKLADVWVCVMNHWDTEHNKCEAAEELQEFDVLWDGMPEEFIAIKEKEDFYIDLVKFLFSPGTEPDEYPCVEVEQTKYPVDMYVLYNQVMVLGGVSEVSKNPEGWSNIAKVLGLPPVAAISAFLEKTYWKYLYAFKQKNNSSEQNMLKDFVSSYGSRQHPRKRQKISEGEESVQSVHEGVQTIFLALQDQVDRVQTSLDNQTKTLDSLLCQRLEGIRSHLILLGAEANSQTAAFQAQLDLLRSEGKRRGLLLAKGLNLLVRQSFSIKPTPDSQGSL